jgi:hypothetical protein
MKAPEILTRSAEIMAERAKQYDSPQGERSMGKAVAAFNAVTGQSLSEANGWLLMALLKMVRDNTTDKPHEDSINDLVAYGALYGEARLASLNQPESGWIEWGGGECPLLARTPVMIRLRNGAEHGPFPAIDASSAFWRNDGYMADIIAYRIVK